MTRFVLTVALSLTATVSETTSPADFNNQTQGKWYKAQGRNCSTKARASCNDWSKWSNTIFLSTPPVFAKTAYSFSLVETSDLGTTVGTVSATDADSGDTVTYSITTGNTKGMFAISNSTGKIVVYNFLDHETAATTTLTIQAKDSHGATGTTTVTVTTTNWFESLVTASTTTPLTGQSVTLTASTDVGSLPGAQYQWQRVDTTKNQWMNVGANTTTTTLTLTSATVATEVYRVTASFRSSNAAPSRPVTIEWQELAASITTDNPFPLSGDSKQRSATLTAHTNAPTGATYKWQESPTTSTNWTDITSTKKTATVSSTVRTTKKYRVIVTNGSHTATSDAVFVTWDLGATLRDITDALAANFATPTATPNAGSNQEGATGQAARTAAYLSKEATLLTCVKDTSTSNGGGEYDSFAELMTQYTGKTKTLLNTTGSNGCSTELTETWTAITTAFTSTFTTISTTGSNAAAINAFLASEPGKSFKKHMLASASLTNSIEDFIVPAANILENEPTPTPGVQGQDGARAQDGDDDDGSFGLSCIPEAGHFNASSSSPLSVRLNVLDCLIFFTPWQFWYDLAEIEPGDPDTPETPFEAAIARVPWLNGGDFDCSPGLARAGLWSDSDAQRAACLKHDIAWGSLQAMGGDTSLSHDEKDEDNDGDELDETWNPRNKHLADWLYYVDNVCQGVGHRSTCLGDRDNFWEASMSAWLRSEHNRRTWAVAEVNDHNWPVTQEDIDHVSAKQYFVSCDPPLPRLDNLKLTRHGKEVRASWNVTESCSGVEIRSKIEICIGGPLVDGCVELVKKGVLRKYRILLWSDVPDSLSLTKYRIYVKNPRGGSRHYDYFFNSDGSPRIFTIKEA